MFGYLTILAAIPGFFLSSWFLMLLWGGLRSRSGMDYYKLCYRNAYQYYPLAGSSTTGSSWQKGKTQLTIHS